MSFGIDIVWYCWYFFDVNGVKFVMKKCSLGNGIILMVSFCKFVFSCFGNFKYVVIFDMVVDKRWFRFLYVGVFIFRVWKYMLYKVLLLM